MIKSCCFYSIKQVLWCNFIHIFILKASTNVRIPLGNQSYKWIQSLHFIFSSCKVLYHSTYCQMCWNLEHDGGPVSLLQSIFPFLTSEEKVHVIRELFPYSEVYHSKENNHLSFSLDYSSHSKGLIHDPRPVSSTAANLPLSRIWLLFRRDSRFTKQEKTWMPERGKT